MLIHSWLIFLLSTLTSIVEAIKCFAGDPLLKHECTTISYCLMILQKSGRTQWSCDGNGFSQPSICSTLGQELNQRQIFETGSSEASFYRTQDLPRGSPSKIEPRISQYGGNGGGTVSDQGSVVARLMGTETAAIKCYDGGDLGKICCCADNFCNTSTRVYSSTSGTAVVILTNESAGNSKRNIIGLYCNIELSSSMVYMKDLFSLISSKEMLDNEEI